MNKLTFTVAICTYNRVNILKRCLSSLAKADSAGTTFEILVIDNNSTDCTKEISTTFAARFLHFRYYFEQQQGLSYARNAAYQLAKGEWLVYLDDDAKVFEDFFLQLQLALSNFPFPCFGGWYSEYYLHERPKWLPIGFGTMTLPRPDSGELKTEIIHGGIMIIKKSLLEELNGFDTKLGMKGKYIGYAEEEEIQVRIRSKREKIGFIKEIQVEHLVGEHKCNPLWHLKKDYAIHRDKNRILPTHLPNALLLCLRTLCITPFKILGYSTRLLHPNYYYQNYLLDLFSPICIRVGTLVGSLKNKLPQ